MASDCWYAKPSSPCLIPKGICASRWDKTGCFKTLIYEDIGRRRAFNLLRFVHFFHFGIYCVFKNILQAIMGLKHNPFLPLVLLFLSKTLFLQENINSVHTAASLHFTSWSRGLKDFWPHLQKWFWAWGLWQGFVSVVLGCNLMQLISADSSAVNKPGTLHITHGC